MRSFRLRFLARCMFVLFFTINGNGDGTVDKKDIIPIVIKAAVIAAGGVHDPSRGSDNQDPTINH